MHLVSFINLPLSKEIVKNTGLTNKFLRKRSEQTKKLYAKQKHHFFTQQMLFSLKNPIIVSPFKSLILYVKALVFNTELIANISFDQFSF